jgi:hypothetical protein
MSALFRGKFLAGLAAAQSRGKLDLGPAPVDPEGFPRLLQKLYRKRWHLYAKRPFGGPEQVIQYLGRYTHRVGISNSRLESMDEDGRVTFRTKNGQKVTLAAEAFLGRFLQHVLPKGFVKIRHYGLLAPSSVGTHLATARTLLMPSSATASAQTREVEGASASVGALSACPVCGGLGLRRIDLAPSLVAVLARGPP